MGDSVKRDDKPPTPNVVLPTTLATREFELGIRSPGLAAIPNLFVI